MLFTPLGVHYDMARLEISPPGFIKVRHRSVLDSGGAYTWRKGM